MAAVPLGIDGPVARRGNNPAPAPTQPQANIWNGVHGPKPPHIVEDSAIVSTPSRKPKRAPNARPARMSSTNTASTPPTPVPTTRTAAPMAVRVPSSASVFAERTSPSRASTIVASTNGSRAIAA